MATNGAIVGISIPRTDYRNYIRQVVESAWKVVWGNVNNNRLRAIKPNTEPFKTCYSKSREWEIKLSRLMIDHIRLTHEYLMSGDNQRYCPNCIVPLTVYHVIKEYPSLVESRSKYLGQPQQLKKSWEMKAQY